MPRLSSSSFHRGTRHSATAAYSSRAPDGAARSKAAVVHAETARWSG
ncbi:hypothetical protein [Pseudonocardia asaccharolytica]|nr:hypothetical protein [Pseudonocardia asaccharolytica]